jgi:hypothetical protein
MKGETIKTNTEKRSIVGHLRRMKPPATFAESFMEELSVGKCESHIYARETALGILKVELPEEHRFVRFAGRPVISGAALDISGK